MSAKYQVITRPVLQPDAPTQVHEVTLTWGQSYDAHLVCPAYPSDVVTGNSNHVEAIRRYFYRQGQHVVGEQPLDVSEQIAALVAEIQRLTQRIAQPKHYYNDLGIQDYEIPDALFQHFKQTLPKTTSKPSEMIFRIMNLASEILVVPTPHPTFCPSRRWSALKAIYNDFIKDGYLSNDFLLVAWHLAVKVSCEDDS